MPGFRLCTEASLLEVCRKKLLKKVDRLENAQNADLVTYAQVMLVG